MEGNKDNLASTSSKENQEEAANIVFNLALAHEIAMNEKFELSEQPENSLQQQVKKVVHQAFWDALQEDLSHDPPNYRHSLRLFMEIKETLLQLLNERHVKLRTLINEALDMALIQQQVEHNALDIHQYVGFVQEVMSKLCAPVRDDEIKKISDIPPQDIVQIFKEIFRILDLMKLDMANFQLKTVRPVVVQQSIEYERKKFREYLETNPDGLLSTTEWLKRATSEVHQGRQLTSHTDLSEPSSEAEAAETSTKDKNMEFLEVLGRGYVSILIGDENWPFPETLIIDEHRLGEMRWNVHRTVLIGSIILVSLNSVGKPLTGDSQYIEKLKEVLYIILDGVPEYGLAQSMPNVFEQVACETDKILETRGFKTMTDEEREVFKAHILDIATPDHAVHALLTKRAQDYLTSVITQAGTSIKPPIPQALSHVQTELTEIAVKFSMIIAHNKAVFSPFYKEIVDSFHR